MKRQNLSLPMLPALLLALLCVLPVAGAATASGPATGIGALLSKPLAVGQSGDNFLPPDVAFRLSATAAGPDRVRLDWVIAPGYYLYRDRIKFATDAAGLALGQADMPRGQVKNDEYFGRQVVYHVELIATVPVARAAGSAVVLPLHVTYQGCAEAGLCYPPITKILNVTLPGTGASAASTGAQAGGAATTAGAGTATTGYQSEQNRLAVMIRDGNLLAVLGTFFGLGLLLAFTPCVLPMVPILSGLIAGQGPKVTTRRAFSLSLIYVLGMAVTYTVAGAAFAAAGQQAQALFQQPWIIVLFAALFVAMAASMFGLFTLQMPSFLMTRLSGASNRQRAGSYGGVAIMGALSALIVTTCVAPPLVATLAVIGQSGDVGRGAAALFAMSLGMGAPLLVVGASAGRLLPRAGAWMDGVKKLFGVMMLAVAAWMLTRIVPASAALVLFAVPAVAAAVVLWNFAGTASPMRAGARALGIVAALYAAALLFGAGAGHDNPLAPLAGPQAADQALQFHPVHSVADLGREVAAAAAVHQAVMLDFYADWCVSCKEMERDTFRQPQVERLLRPVRLLRADVTANNADDQQLLHLFKIFGPPTIAFYDDRGQEQPEYRVVGYMKSTPFAALLRRALATPAAPPARAEQLARATPHQRK